MGDHLKRYVAPDSWGIARKVNTFIIKPSPGPHNANAMPIAVWLRDHMGLARNMKEVRQILKQRDLIINGRPCRHPSMGIGIFDIIALPKTGRFYRILRDKKGRHKTIEIDEAAAQTRLVKIVNKTLVRGGKVQLNLRDGSNLIADNTYMTRDSVVLSLKEEDYNKIVDHFPYLEGNMAMVIGGKHSGVVARIKEIIVVPGSVPNRVLLTNESSGTMFETIDEYVVMVGRQSPAIDSWGIEE